MTKQTKTAVGIVAVIAILIGGSWLLLGKNQADNLAAVGTTSGDDRLGIAQTSDLEVSDQLPGAVVYIKNVNLPQGGWVVIHKPDTAGTLGPIIGYKYFDGTTHTGTIALVTPTTEGSQYLAVLYSDNGNKTWDTNSDVVMTNSSGLLIAVPFSTTDNLPEIKG